ncbi:BMP family ABC transporter substrate-binding protein [Rathayibacter sp. YIM 133350]|uniref:BMP family lipoprotein n=1 Tax=Rathayibacter sp. YIM 133350 TaxID=3131992 RepID=UPI00307F9729
MTITIRKAAVGGLAALSVAALLSACASAPEEASTSGAAKSDYIPCMVSDAGGFNDKSFNQLGYEGLQKAAKELGVKAKTVESSSDSDYAPNLKNLVDQGCNTIVTVGFNLSAATVESAKANPDIDYVIIDDAADNDFDGKVDAPNIKPILSDTAQAAFLAGYAAADFSKTAVVGTFGGLPIPPVTIFMDGFKQGVDYHNTEKGTSVKVLGAEGEQAAQGVFTGGFEAGSDAQKAAQGLIDQNVDVLLPVGGPIYQSAAAQIRAAGRDIALIGVDADVFETDPSVGDLLLTSIRKSIDVGVYDAITAAGKGDFDPSTFVGTLENDGVGLAPFHDFKDKVSPDLQGELDKIKAGIIDGSIKVTSYLNQ